MEKGKTEFLKTSDSYEINATSSTVSDPHPIMVARGHKNRKPKCDQHIPRNSDSFGSTILAGSGRCLSQKSSGSSFYSAESTIVTKKLPTTDCDENSTPALEDSSNNVTDSSEEIESSSVATCSLNNASNDNIEMKLSASTPVSMMSIRSDVDLNKAQNLFKSTNSHNRDANYNVDGVSNTSYTKCEEENLHFLLGNHSTTQYSEIPQFVKKFIALSKDADSKTSKEIGRRLTTSFHQDPQEFANRLITIIEEPDTNYELEKSAVSVNKMVSAYLKLCKYVEEESMPSMYDISSAHHESFQIAYSGQVRNIIDNHLSHETPPNSGMTQRRFGPKISPMNHKKNAAKTLSSPLYVSTLTRATAPTKTPTTSASPGSTPGSARHHNDSSFTFWERKCEVSPYGKRDCTTPDITDEEKLRLAKAEKQLRILQAADSPNLSPIKTQINVYNIHCDMQKSSSEYETSPTPQSKYNMDTSSNMQSSYNEKDMMESIMYEFAEKRKRCFETERTIRQIDAESSAYSNSPQASENEESEKILGFLNALRNCTNYQDISERDKNKSSFRRYNNSESDNKSLLYTRRKHRNKSKEFSNNPPHNLAGVRDNQHLNVTIRKPTNAAASRAKSPTVKTSRISLSGKGVKSDKPISYIKSPASSSRRIASAHLVARSISPIDGQTARGASKSGSIIQIPKTPLKLSVRTPRAKSPNLKTYPPITSKNRLFCKTPELSAKKSSVSNTQVVSNTAGTSKSDNCKKSQLSTTDKGFTLKYLNSTSRLPSVNNRKGSTAIKSQRENKYCIPTVSVTSATPEPSGYKKSQHTRILTETNIDTPTTLSRGRNVTGRFFNTPGKTPQPKIRPKPTTFFSVVDGERKPLLKSQMLTKYYNPGEVKSPVAEYVNGTDSTLLQNIRGKKNEYLLTPKKKNSGLNQLKFKLAAKKNAEKKSTKNQIFGCEVESISDVNDENVNHNGCNLPKVSYQMPAAVHEIHANHNSPRGARAKLLMEAKDSRVVIQHAGRAIPHIRTVEPVDMSIHVAKSAEKKKFVLRSKDIHQKF